MTLDEIASLLVVIQTDLAVIKRDLGEDYKVLHGNGHPGLQKRVTDLETNMQILKSKSHWYKDWFGWALLILSILISFVRK